MARFGNFDQYLDNAGDPLAEGKLYFYESGTTTPKTTYSDVNNSIPNTNPVLLTAAGRQPNIFFEGVAKVILTDNNDVQIAVRDPVGETATDFGDEWVASKIYSANDVVLGSNGVYYRSLSNGNQNNNPVTSSGYWTLLYSVEWNSGITYDVGAVVTYENQQYQSLQGSNLNNNPSTASSYWVSLAFAWLSTTTYAEDQNVVGTDGILYTSLQNANTGNDPATSPAYWVGTSAAAAASATAAAASATAAAASETAAETAETNAETAQAAAEAAQAAAETAETNAETAETNAASSATAAASSATAAATSETNAATSASQSATSATASAASATAALASETAAAASETAAAASESAAATSETNAATSATASATSATNSANSATASASSATDSANSATASAGSATAAASSATAAAGSATAAAGSATAAATSASDAAATYDAFDDRYLGEKASDPTTDNDGNPLITGALYFNNVSNVMKVYTGSAWTNVAPTATSVTVSQISDYTGDATTLNYTSNLSSDAQTQLNAKVESLSDLGVTATSTELNYVDGVTSAIQAQLNNKEPADATILKDADIGVTVQGYDADTAKYDDATANFTGTLQNGGSNVLVDSDIDSTILGYVAPSTSGNILTSNGTSWTSSAPAGGGAWELLSSSYANNVASISYDWSSTDYAVIKIFIYDFACDRNTDIEGCFRYQGSDINSSYYRNMVSVDNGTNYISNYTDDTNVVALTHPTYDIEASSTSNVRSFLEITIPTANTSTFQNLTSVFCYRSTSNDTRPTQARTTIWTDTAFNVDGFKIFPASTLADLWGYVVVCGLKNS